MYAMTIRQSNIFLSGPPFEHYYKDITLFLTPLTLSLPRLPLIDFTLCNARWFYSSMGNPTGVKGLSKYMYFPYTAFSTIEMASVTFFISFETVAACSSALLYNKHVRDNLSVSKIF